MSHQPQTLTEQSNNTSKNTANSHQQHLIDPSGLITQSGQYPIQGANEHSDIDLPDEFTEEGPVVPSDSDKLLTFKDLLPTDENDYTAILPNASTGELRSVNEFINDDGSIDTEAIQDILKDEVLKDIPVDIENVEHAQKTKRTKGHVDVVDKRRKALDALLPDQDIPYRWQIATDSYSTINPRDAYRPLYLCLQKRGEEDNVIGWVEFSDWGGSVDIFLLFTDKSIDNPTGDGKMYAGLQTGYDFSGGRAFETKLFGYNPSENIRFWNLGERRSRRHIGDPNNAEHERDNNRMPIQDWWENGLSELSLWVDSLVEDIEFALEHIVDFSGKEFGIQEFYEYLDFPNSYIDPETDNRTGAVERARKIDGGDSEYSVWTLYYAMTRCLEKEFQGENKRTSTQFQAYAQVSTRILRRPLLTMSNIEREHRRQQEDETKQTQPEKALGNGDDDVDPDSLTDIQGVSSQTIEWMTDRTRDQLDLFEFDEAEEDSNDN